MFCELYSTDVKVVIDKWGRGTEAGALPPGSDLFFLKRTREIRIEKNFKKCPVIAHICFVTVRDVVIVVYRICTKFH